MDLEIKFVNLGPPRFVEDLKDIKVTVNQFYTLRLPSIIDPDFEDKVSIKNVEFDAASIFVTQNNHIILK